LSEAEEELHRRTMVEMEEAIIQLIGLQLVEEENRFRHMLTTVVVEVNQGPMLKVVLEVVVVLLEPLQAAMLAAYGLRGLVGMVLTAMGQLVHLQEEPDVGFILEAVAEAAGVEEVAEEEPAKR